MLNLSKSPNCCISMVVKHILFATCVVSLPLGASFNTIFSMQVTPLLLSALLNKKCSYLQIFLLEHCN